MNVTVEKGVALWNFKNLDAQSGIKHFVSGREGGVSCGDQDSLNLSFSVGEPKENVYKNRSNLAEAIGIQPDQLFFVSQYHSDQVLIATTKSDGNPAKADAIVTNVKGICICAMSADCVPILSYDPVKQAIAAIHAGWRGTAASITFKTLKLLSDQFGSKPADIMLAIGPSISQEKYEVGEEVYNSFIEQQGEKSKRFFKHNYLTNKYFPDLWQANKAQAVDFGLNEENIEIAGICTYSNPDKFYSARYFKNKTGRFAAGIMLQ